MKLINLKMEYFGPFEREEIDFSSLNNKLFLISGRTGSGKTMIFDAIVYALYGSASTTGRDEESLRSQFAPEDKQAQVKLTFEVRGKQYTVERTLKYHKPGNKSATPPKAVLYDEEDNILASKLNDVRDMVEDVVKLNRAQFRKILILPQGEFKELLVSPSTDKQDILRTLFQTGRFLDFENNLKEKLKEQSAEATLLDLKINERVKLVHTSDIEIIEQEEFPNYTIILEYVDGVIYSYEKKLEELSEENIKLKSELDNKQQALVKKQQHNEQVDKLNQLKEQQASLKQQVESVNQWRQELKSFEEVSSIKYELLRQKELSQSELETTESYSKEQKLSTELKAELKQSSAELTAQKDKEPEMNKREQQYYKHEAFLSDQYETVNTNITEAQSQLEEKEAEVKINAAKIAEINETLEKITATYAVSTELQQKQHNLDSDVKNLEQEIEDTKSHQKMLDEQASINQSIVKNNENIFEFKNKLNDFNNNLTDYEEETVQAINHLIEHLEVGAPCPICEQTVLMLPESNGFTEADKEQLNTITESIAELEQQNQKHVMRIDVIDEVLKDKEYKDAGMLEIELKSVREQRDDIDKKLKETNAELELKEELTSELSQSNDSMHNLKILRHDLKTSLDGFKKMREEFVSATGYESYSDFKVHMNEEYASINEFQKKLNQTQDKVNELAKAHELNDAKVQSLSAELKKTAESLSVFNTQIETFMSEKNYSSLEKLHVIINDESIAAKKEKIKSFDDSYLSLKNQLDELLNTLESTEKVSVDEDIESVQAAESALEAAREYHAAVNERKNQNIESRKSLAELIDTFNASYEEFNQLSELVEAVQGKKGQKVSLERYVLTYYLERILELANVRLTAMTNHRYKLQRSMKKINRFSGLDIEVFDFYNNQARNINSLSGGETFQASLVLALALNEALQQESGGITLDTMLIDEGFGTLDHETLEVAISTLIDLQTTGKTIGIISHVEELKERMEHILHVLPNNERSTTKIITL